RHREGAGSEAQRPHYVEVVLARGRVVLEAAQDHAVQRRPHLALRGFDDGQPQLARGKLHAVQVAGDPAVRAQDHAHRGVLVLLRLLVVPVAKTNRIRESTDGWVTSGEKWPMIRIRLHRV